MVLDCWKFLLETIFVIFENSEQSCFEGVGGIAKRVINQLENKSNGTKTEQAKFRAKMNQEFLHHGQMYEHSLERLKTRMDSEKVLLNDSVAQYRDLEAQSYLSNREIENLRSNKVFEVMNISITHGVLSIPRLKLWSLRIYTVL